eukprot:3519222-Pleurochrysis_carterae.AAC.1
MLACLLSQTCATHLTMTIEDHAAIYTKGRLDEALEHLKKADTQATELGMTARAADQRMFKAEGDVNEAQNQRVQARQNVLDAEAK